MIAIPSVSTSEWLGMLHSISGSSWNPNASKNSLDAFTLFTESETWERPRVGDFSMMSGAIELGDICLLCKAVSLEYLTVILNYDVVVLCILFGMIPCSEVSEKQNDVLVVKR
jgi:hypothetical protein